MDSMSKPVCLKGDAIIDQAVPFVQRVCTGRISAAILLLGLTPSVISKNI
jgi:hypothetical protein